MYVSRYCIFPKIGSYSDYLVKEMPAPNLKVFKLAVSGKYFVMSEKNTSLVIK